ncbi:MAG: hypothetical protein HY722_07155 [Planctomycetes bacterium]|nr:hypothetical protein [Planctomycetota bacterium]
MSPLLGQALDGRELEIETSGWSDERFAGFCDSLVWAVSRRTRSGVPSFTFNTNAPDGGVDAECYAEVPASETPLMERGWNVFQYKKRDVHASDRKKIVAGLKAQLKGAIRSVEMSQGRKPEHYILCINVNLDHKEKKALRSALLDGFVRPAGFPDPAILGAAELAQLLNGNPHLRAAYFQPGAFRTWKAAWDALGALKYLGKDTVLRGREDLLAKARALMGDTRIRVVVLWGPHDVGKSRLALETTRDHMDTVVVAADPQNLAAGDLRTLVSGPQEVLCIVEDLEPQRIDALIQEALATPNLKLILTVPIPSQARIPAYGVDDRVQHMEVAPLGREDAKALINEVSPQLHSEIEDWICRKSGGIPGVVITAATVGEALREGAADFEAQVGKEFARRIEAQFGGQALASVRVVSLLTQLGVAGKYSDEARCACDRFGGGMTITEFLRQAKQLSEEGVLRRRGSFLEVVIPMLANHLAGDAVHGKPRETMALFARLEAGGQDRLLRRLAGLDGSAVPWFWDALLEERNLLDHAPALEGAAGAAPVRTADALKALLNGASIEVRKQIAGDRRRHLVHALEQLLFRRKTSREALRLMGLLAEAENETWANNATEVFAQCFCPHHPQMPLPLNARLDVLRIFSGKSTPEGRHVALRAVDGGVPGVGGSIILRYPVGPALFDRPHAMTYGDLRDYYQCLMEIACSLAQGDGAVAVEARSKLPDFGGRLGLFTPPCFALPWFERLTEMALGAPPALDVSAVSQAIEWTVERLDERMGEEGIQEDARKELTEARTALHAMRERIDTADFPVRLRRWLGEGVWFRLDEQRQTEAAEALADEAVAHPGRITDEDWDWLHSSDAQGASLFVAALGRKDVKGILRETVESRGAAPRGADILSSYWHGWSARDPDSAAKAEQRLDELTAGDKIDGRSVVLATWRLEATKTRVDRIIDQIRRGRVDADHAARLIVRGRWMAPLDPGQAASLIEAIGGDVGRNGSGVVGLIGMWLRLKKPLTGDLEELAWRVLESDPPVTPIDAWHCDQVAAHLARNSPNRAFALLEHLAGTEREGKWDPLKSHAENVFWGELCAIDCYKALGAVARAAGKPLRRMTFMWTLKKHRHWVADRDAVLKLARESVQNARFLAGCLTAEAKDFWSLADELLSLYPDDDRLWVEIVGDIEGMNQVIAGPYSGFLAGRRAEVARVIADPATRTPLRRRLQDWLGRVEERIGQHVTWEYDEDIDDLMSHVRDKDSPQRIWAIGRILKYASMEEIRKLLTVEDIENALPNVDLPAERQRMFEAALQVWKHGR